MTVKKELADHHINEGWEFDRELKTTIRLKKQKPIDERLENRFWVLLHKLGYHELNKGRHFQVTIKRVGADNINKQIDVFGKDDETVIIAECKSSINPIKRSLQKDLEEFGSLQKPIANAIRAHYGKNFKPKIIWMFVTHNIIWSKPDKARAHGLKIHYITERELRYYQQIADHLGNAARYQFLAEFLQGEKIHELKNKRIPAIRGKLGGKSFFSFVTTPKDLLKISFVNHRSLNDPAGAPSYQRLVSRTRIKQIEKFIVNGGFFPTNILINFTKKIRFDVVKKDEQSGVHFGHLHLPDCYRSAWIVDGQHRLYGFSHLDESHLKQNITVIAFDHLKKEEEANLFVTINHEQKTVPKTLLDDLEGELKWGSDKPTERIGAVSSRLINILNTDHDEPFYSRVVQQGITASDYMCLTVPAIKDGLRKSGLVGKATLNKSLYEPGPFCGKTDTETVERARAALNSYFTRIKDNAFSLWQKGRVAYLCSNVAIQAYLLLLGELINYMESNAGFDAKDLEPEVIILEIEEYLDPVLLFLSSASTQKMQDRFKVQFGSGGPPEYFYRLCSIIKNKYSDFLPDGMEKWETEQSEENVDDADKKIKKIGKMVQKYIFTKLKDKYGEEKNAYWEKGVTNKEIKTQAYKKSQEDELEKRLDLENYLDFLDYKKIVGNKENWPMFRSTLNIPEPSVKGISKNIKWMERINELRRIPAHSTEARRYKADDFDYIGWIYSELVKRLSTEGK